MDYKEIFDVVKMKYKRRLLLAVLALSGAFLAPCGATAQNKSDNRDVSLSFGVFYPQTVDATLSYEVETKYHNAWEFFANGAAKWKDCPSCGHVCAESFWKDHPTWGIGAAYKPCVQRSRNSYGRMRFGASLGSNTDRFLGGIHAGYEQNYSLRGGWRLFWQAKVDCLIKNEDLFRAGITIGVAMPVGNK